MKKENLKYNRIFLFIVLLKVLKNIFKNVIKQGKFNILKDKFIILMSSIFLY